MNFGRFLLITMIILVVIGCEKEKYKYASKSDYGQYAPPDAFKEDTNFAYYGSENEWNKRMFSDDAIAKYYKRQGQRQMLEILDGDFDEAINICKKILEKQPNDLESYFNLSVVYCQKGIIDSAIYYMHLALEHGLPFSRYLAGPQDLLNPLYSTKEFNKIKEDRNVKIVHGPMKGSITTTGAKIWLRTVDESAVDIKVKAKDGKIIGVYSGESKANNDYTVVIPITNLHPGKKYFYNIIVDGEMIRKNYILQTYKKSYLNDKIKIGFGGGAGYTFEHEYIWETINDYSLEAFLLLGDNVYVDLPKMPGDFHNYTYFRRQSNTRYRKFLEKNNVYAIWDDHDAAIDDIWMGPYIDKPSWKLPMLNHFKRQWVNPYYGTENNPGCYFNFKIGEVEFFMLDTRFYRTNPFKEERTMLGSEQKDWLKEKILDSEAIIKVIVSSVPWALEAKPGSKDTWAGFKTERKEIFRFLSNNNIKGVILLSADRHRTDVWKIERKKDYPLYEFESSKLANIHTHKIMPESIIAYNEKCSFGLLEFNFLKDKIIFDIISIDGNKKGNFEVNFNELK